MIPPVWALVPALVVPAPMLLVSHLDARTAQIHGTPARVTPTVHYTIVLLDAEYVHVAWLRQKIEPNAKHPQFILTIHGMGYKFAE